MKTRRLTPPAALDAGRSANLVTENTQMMSNMKSRQISTKRPASPAVLEPGKSANPATQNTQKTSNMKYRQISIIYGQGQELRFEFPIQATEENMAQRIEEALKLPSVSLSTGDALYVIPTTSILTVIVKPAPKKLPPTVIRAAKLIGVGET